MPSHPHNSAVKGIGLMIVAVGAFALMDTIAKYLSRYYPVPVIVWARYALNLVLLLAYLIATRRFDVWRAKRPGIQLARGLLLATGTLLFFTSLTVLPMAEAAAIGFVLPLFVVALAVPMLKERLDMARLAAIVVGLVGVLVIVRPGSGVFTWYSLLPLGMAFCNALFQVLTRMVAGVDKPYTSLLYGSLVGAVVLSMLAPFFWLAPQGLWHWSLLLLLGVLATLGHFALIRGFDQADASLLAPFTYTQLVWAMLLGWIVFDNLPDGWSLIGMAVIVASGIYIVNRQRLTVEH
jgi:drug/metabolite transporter (DMT)-like permease